MADISKSIARMLTEELFLYQPSNDEYQPQYQFHRSGALIRLFSGGNGSGKSHCGAAEFASALLGAAKTTSDACQPEIMQLRASLGLRQWSGASYPDPPIHGWIIKHRLPVASETDAVIQKLLYGGVTSSPGSGQPCRHGPFIPPRLFGSYSRNQHFCRLKNGSTFQIKSAEQDPSAMSSDAPAVIWIDEPISPVAWEELKMRLIRTHGARLFLTLTPADMAMGYLDELMQEKDPEKVECFFAHTEANPYLPPLQKKIIIDMVPVHLRDTRLHGMPLHLTGLVYPEWDNWVRPFQVPEHWTRYVCHDPGIHNPCATLWAAVEPGSHDIYLYRCDYDESHSSNVAATAKRIRQLTSEHVYRWYIDPFAARVRVPSLADPTNETNLLMLYRSCGIPFMPGPTQYELAGRQERVYATKLYLDRNVVEFPNLFAFDTLDALRMELRRYRFATAKKGDVNSPDRPFSKYDHLMYCMETLCSLRIKHVPSAVAAEARLEDYDPWREIAKRMDERWEAPQMASR